MIETLYRSPASPTVYVPKELRDARCCWNCRHAQIVRLTGGGRWHCVARRRRGENRFGVVATKTGLLSGSLKTIRGCRAFETMTSDDDPQWEDEA